MPFRLIASLGLAVVVAAGSVGGPGAFAQSPGVAKPFTPPRTPDGRPDLQGIWSFATVTPLQRPASLGDKATLTPEEAAQFEKEAVERANADRRTPGTAADVGLAYNDFWYDRGTQVVANRQTSLIVDPPDGRLPPTTAEAQQRAAARAAERRAAGPADGPESRGLAERCLMGFNAGPPMTPSAYNNNMQIVLTRDHAMIMTEMVHEARIVPLDGRPHLDPSMRLWTGDSRGRWEGDTLVVETTNFTSKTGYRGSTENMRLIERFSLADADTLIYEFTVDDPATWTRPWTARVPMTKSSDQIYEYACHEANYGMEGILRGARADEQRGTKP